MRANKTMVAEQLSKVKNEEKEAWDTYRNTGDPETLKEVARLVEERYKTVKELTQNKLATE